MNKNIWSRGNGIVLSLVLIIICLAVKAFLARDLSPEWFIKDIKLNAPLYILAVFIYPLIIYFQSKRIDDTERMLQTQRDEFEQSRRIFDIGKKRLESKNTELATEAIVDPLTGLHNRKYIQSCIDKEIQRVMQLTSLDPVLFAMMLDIDDFKGINDNYGHAAGDFVLKQIARVLKKSTRSMDFVGRLGGDEFIIILPESNMAVAEKIAYRVRDNIRSQPYEFGGETLNVAVSIGVTPYDVVDDSTSEALIEKADWCLISAKRAGKDQVIIKK